MDILWKGIAYNREMIKMPEMITNQVIIITNNSGLPSDRIRVGEKRAEVTAEERPIRLKDALSNGVFLPKRVTPPEESAGQKKIFQDEVLEKTMRWLNSLLISDASPISETAIPVWGKSRIVEYQQGNSAWCMHLDGFLLAYNLGTGKDREKDFWRMSWRGNVEKYIFPSDAAALTEKLNSIKAGMAGNHVSADKILSNTRNFITAVGISASRIEINKLDVGLGFCVRIFESVSSGGRAKSVSLIFGPDGKVYEIDHSSVPYKAPETKSGKP